jgi:hypothetical protein
MEHVEQRLLAQTKHWVLIIVQGLHKPEVKKYPFRQVEQVDPE